MIPGAGACAFSAFVLLLVWIYVTLQGHPACFALFMWWWRWWQWWWWWLFPCIRGFRGRFDGSFLTCAFFVASVLQIARAYVSHSLGQDQSTVSWDNWDEVFPDELHVSAFLIGALTMPGQRPSQPSPTSLGLRYMHKAISGEENSLRRK